MSVRRLVVNEVVEGMEACTETEGEVACRDRCFVNTHLDRAALVTHRPNGGRQWIMIAPFQKGSAQMRAEAIIAR